MLQTKHSLLAVLVATALAGCSSDQILLQNKVDYRSGSDNINKNALEVPPDLTALNPNNNFAVPNSALLTEKATASSSTANSTVLPAYQNAKIVQSGNLRWLLIKGDPAKIWPELREFWLSNGFLLTQDNPQTGVMETDWLENRANLPADFVTKLLRKVADSFISTGEMDRYRTRIERGSQEGTVEVYVTHRGMREVFADGSNDAKVGANSGETKTIWTPRASDPELEAEIYALMLQRFGMTQEQAKEVVKTGIKVEERARLAGEQLEVIDGFDRAWRRVGLAFDRIGYVVQDRNRSEGTYLIQRAAADIGKEKDDSTFAKLAFWRSKDAPKMEQVKQYEVKLTEKLDRAVLTISAKEGNLDAATRQKILQDLLQQLK